MSKASDSLDRKRKAMTEAFVKAVETAGTWFPDWITQVPRNFITGSAYRGINRFMLPMHQMLNGWTSPLFAGKGQIKSAGGRIRDDEFRNGVWVFFWGRYTSKKTDPVTGEEEERTYWFPKAYQVWNLDQVEGVKESRIKGRIEPGDGEPIEDAEAMLKGYLDAEGIALIGGGPAYSPQKDQVLMPELSAFKTAEGYYDALAHECTHSTGHETRLDREIRNIHGDHKYSREELVAQLGAAFIRAELGLHGGREERDAAYLASWLKAMKADPSMLFDAASDAEKAVAYIRNAAGIEEPEQAEEEPANV